MSESIPSSPDIVLVGAGIMSATLAVLLKQLDPTLTIELYESLETVAEESSDAWNNAGTGHAALCELNYTPERPDGSVDISKALKINESFEVSKQFWTYLVEQKLLSNPQSFINQVPHLSFVWGEKNVTYLRRRFEALSKTHLFRGMEFSENRAKLAEWMPLIMEGREGQEPLAANFMPIGTDVNFGALTRNLIEHVQALGGVSVFFNHRVQGLSRIKEGGWNVRVQDKKSGVTRVVRTKFAFLGAGGGALPLLQSTGIPEGKGFGGFPVSGLWLVCNKAEHVLRHDVKVYGKASVGSPPMSVPHLDTRMINGKKGLLFGPFAGFSTKFLKRGSYLDLPLSLRLDNLWPMIKVGLDNMDLTKYLISQVLQSPKDRLKALQDFVPTAQLEDWDLLVAGQRVQVIKKDPKKGGILQFGTEVICAADGSISALLGASPGASTSVPIMVEVIERCFKDRVQSPEWQAKLKQMIPSYGKSLIKDSALYDQIRAHNGKVLGINETFAMG